MRTAGVTLAALTVVLSGMVLLTAKGFVDAAGDRIAVISQATYTFYTFVSVTIGFARKRRGQDAVERTLRGISVVSALVSMFSLQTTMLATFGSGSALFHTLTVVTGTVVCAACAAVGASLVVGVRTVS